MISFFGSFVLMLVGAMCTTDELSKYRPSLRLLLEGLSPFRGYIGIGTAFYGLVSMANTLSHAGWLVLFPFIYLTMLFSGLIAVLVGVLLGFETASKFLVGHIPDRWSAKIRFFHKKLVVQQINLGYAALALGLFHLLLRFVTPEFFVLLWWQ